MIRVLVAGLLLAGAAAPAAAQSSMLPRYNLADDNPRKILLPPSLSEASGLAVTGDGRILIHDDERGVVSEIDPASGTVRSSFSVGTILLREDFEGIAVRGSTGYLVNSAGTIFAFPLGRPGERVSFTLYRTPLTTKNDVEGLEYDPETDCLLLACKGDGGRGVKRGERAVYAWSVRERRLEAEPRFILKEKAAGRSAHRGRFAPSGIARHPVSGTFFLVSAAGYCVMELSPDGAFLGAQSISRTVNPQAEGIVFAPDLTLLLCNDGQGGRGSVVAYPPLP